MTTQYKHIVLLVVDGAGTFFTQTPMPRMAEIFANGATTTDCLSAFPTISAQCYGSILHGVTPSKHGLTNDIASSQLYANAEYPSCFKLIRDAMPDAALAAYCNWWPIYHGIIEPDLDVLTETGGDAELTTKIVSCIKEHKPTFLFIQFDDIDGTGHGYGYGSERYLKSLTSEEALIGSIWDAVCEAGMADDTLFIVSADHGGAGTSHGGLSDTEKYVYFAARGATIAPVHDFPMHLRDIASVVCHGLGIEKHPSWDSYLPTGLFTDATEADCRPATSASEFSTHVSKPTPGAEDAGYIGNYIDKSSILSLFHFDGNENDSFGSAVATRYGKIYYSEGYHGECVGISAEGYVSFDGISLDGYDFSIAMWLRPVLFPSQKSFGESVILTNKKVGTAEPGFTAELLSSEDSLSVRFTVTYPSGRICQATAPLSDGARGAFTHVAFLHCPGSGHTIIAINFEMTTESRNPPKEGESLSLGGNKIILGRDMDGSAQAPLEADVDDLGFFKCFLTYNDAPGAFRAYYR